MALKIVRKGEVKTAKPGSAKTGAKVEKVKSGKGQPGSSVGRFTGRTTGLSVTKYQNQSIEQNLKRRKSDEELALEWKREFPDAKADYTAETVRGVRNLFNKGKHGNDEPRTKVPQFIDGEAQPFWGEKSAAKAAAREEKAAPAKKAKIILKKKGKK